MCSENRLALLEALLFVSKEPLAPEKIGEFFGLADIRELELFLREAEQVYLEDPRRGVTLKRVAGGLQLVTKQDFHQQLTDFMKSRQKVKLSLASLETLAIIAYRQPVTLAEISELRSVNSVGPVKNLLEKKLVRVSGRKRVPGLPALYSTSRDFLSYFGLNSLEELPSLEELTELFEEKEQPGLFKILK